MSENLEQPKQESLGSNENFGKFKDAESLLKAYSNLEAEFTKKSQKLASLEEKNALAERENNKRAEIETKVEEFVTKFENVKPFSSALKESLIQNDGLKLEEEALRLILNSYKRAEDFVTDGEFLNNYIFQNKEIKDKIIKDYVSQITQNLPIKMESNSNILLSKPNVPTTIKEAGKMARSIIKQK